VRKCKKCGSDVPDSVDYCNTCAEEHKAEKEENFVKACPESAKTLEQEKQCMNGFREDLRDGAFQKGIMWRKNKLQAIHDARQAGATDAEILKELRIGGITIQKARELMRDSEELLGR
jgi:hypothetical protein